MRMIRSVVSAHIYKRDMKLMRYSENVRVPWLAPPTNTKRHR